MIRRGYSGPINTFSLGFDEPTDELDDAAFVATELETEHHEIVLTEPALPYLADAIRYAEQPKVNSLQLYLLHRFIGEHVKCVLSGLGGDELFAGYDIYGYLGPHPPAARPAVAGSSVRAALSPTLDWTARRLAALGRPQLDLATRKLEWLAAVERRGPPLPAAAQRLGLQRPAARAGVHPGLRRPARDRVPRRLRSVLRRRRAARGPGPAGRVLRRRW